MIEQIAVKTVGLIKDYHIYDHPMQRFKELIIGGNKHRVFRALGPLDLEIKKGETLAIVGENGAGKSTLLKLVAKVIEPSFGSIEVTGKVSSILELGVGFNPEFSGKENVILNGVLLGLTPEDISGRLQAIEEFAEIGEFFYMPVKTYSSGMYLRLAFSLAVHVDADIILIDEALAVGDGLFEKRCIDKIWELKRRGSTILFCSHSMYTVANFCDRVLWLKGGLVQSIGETKQVIAVYEDYLREKGKSQGAVSDDPVLTDRKVARVNNIRLLLNGVELDGFVPYGSDIEALIDFQVLESHKIYIGFAIDRNDGLCCFADNMMRWKLRPFEETGQYSASIFFKSLPLLDGVYKLVVFLIDETGICIFDRLESLQFKVRTEQQKEWGVCYLPHEWKL